MKTISGPVVRRALAATVLLCLAGCGDGGASGSSPGTSSGSASADASSSPDATPATPGGADPGASADGRCGGGAYATKVVEASQGVSLTVPADWEVQRAKAGAANGLYPPDRDAGDGYLVVQQKQRTLDEAVDETLASTVQAARKTAEKDLELEGFDGARLVTFTYEDGTFSVDVVAVADGLLVAANLTREGVPADEPVAESCLSSLSRTS